MKRLLLYISIFLGIQSYCWAQTQLSGTILDGETETPLIGVTVSVRGTGNGAITDLDGKYTIDLALGKSIVEFSYIGFATVVKQIEVTEETQPIVLDLSMTTEALIGETIIVTDGKFEKKLEESTVSIDVIENKRLENNNLTSLDEVVQKVSGVQITDGQISIRGGAGYAYGVGSRVIFLVDGQPLLSGELSDIKWNIMPIENAAQIEIIKGSASVLYGSGALNGVVNLRTAYPKGDKPYTAISLYAGAYDQPQVDSMRWFTPQDNAASMPMFAGLYFAHRQRLHKNFDIVLGGNIHMKNGYVKGVDERRFRFNFTTRYRDPKSDGRISYGINGNLMYHEEGRFFMSKDMQSNAYLNLNPINRDRYLSLVIDPYLTAFDKHDNKHDVRARWFRVARLQPGNDSDADLFSLEYQFQRAFKNDWVVTAGTMGQYFHVNSNLFAPIDSSWDVLSLVTASTIAAYAQVDKKFFDRLAFTLGVRWEGYAVGGNFIPTLPIVRAGLNFEATANDFIRASFGQGFRFPSMAERFFNERIEGTPVGIFPNPDLLPETGWSTEIGYRHTFVGKNFKFYVDLALFWMEYENMVEFSLGVHSGSFGFSFINVSKARIAGWELSTQGEAKIGKIPVRFWAGYTYSYPGDLSADTSSIRNADVYLGQLFKTFVNGVQRPKDLGNILKYRRLHTLRLDAEVDLWGVTVGSAVNYNSFMQNIDQIFEFNIITSGVTSFRSIHNKGYWVWDLRLGYRINKKQHINLVVQNVLNEVYATRPAQMGAPRSFSIKYSHIF